MGVKKRAGTKGAFGEVLDAIRTLKEVEASGRPATADERAVMAKFTGFGAYANTAFPDPVTGEYRKGWETPGAELRNLLTDEEYASAAETTYSAFYTSDVVMSEMYRALARMGITTGSRGLEAGCGVGNFIGASSILGTEFIGIEKDSLSGRMAKLIHPDHDIRVEDFSRTDLPDGCVDFVVGNVPFASDVKLPYRGTRHSLHDFFMLKSMDALRAGGVMAVVTSRYTMDKKNPKVREMLAAQADFVGAVRLPSEAFKDQGTGVVTDIIFLRKKPLELGQSNLKLPDDSSWLNSKKTNLAGGEVPLNEYFYRNPQMVVGKMSVGQGMYGDNELRVRSDGEIAAALHYAVDGLPWNICTPRAVPLADTAPVPVDPTLPEGVQEGSYFIAADRTIKQVVFGRGETVKTGGKPLSAGGTKAGRRIGLLIKLRDQAREVLEAQHNGAPVEERDAARRRLRSTYASFKAQYGPINKTTVSERQDGGLTRRTPNLLRFMSDPDATLVMALENYDQRTGEAEPATIMHHDVATKPEPVEAVTTAKDGLVASLNQLAAVDIPFITSLYGRDEDTVIEELGQLIFFDPAEDKYVPADEYLSGNVKEKLEIAQKSDDPRAGGNAKALEAVQPEDLTAEEIHVTLGTPWIPRMYVEKFVSRVLVNDLEVEYIKKDALWRVKPTAAKSRRSALAVSKYGTERVDAYTLIEQALNMQQPTVRDKVPGSGDVKDKYVVNQQETLAAREKQAQLKQKFSEWIFSDPARRKLLVSFYNKNFNNIRPREFDGSHLTFSGMSTRYNLFDHQKNAVWRNLTSGNSLLAHSTGAGKTFTMLATGMEMKRLGMANKPVYVVPNHMLRQFAADAQELYPGAKMLIAGKEDLSKDRRKLVKARIAMGEWDGIILTHSSFEKMAMSPEFQAQFIKQEIAENERILTNIDDKSMGTSVRKRIEKLKTQHKHRLSEAANVESKDDDLFFDHLGIDHVFMDEAHYFKNLFTATKMDRVAGVQTKGSQRAFDLYMKARYLHSRWPNHGLTFATATPISNSLGEMYTMMRYLIPEELEARGIGHFDAWAAAFGEIVNALGISPDGKSLKVQTRFAEFKNLPELLSLFRMTADVQTEDMLNLPTPDLAGGKPKIIVSTMTANMSAYQDRLVDRYEAIRNGEVDSKYDNVLNVVTDGRKLAMDPRLIDPNAEDDPDSKVNRLVGNIFDIWNRTADDKLTQMVFSDLGVNPNSWGFSVYNDIIEKLVARGIPRDEIATMGDAKTDAAKEALFSKVRAGNVRILLGSTEKMGTGTNVQDRLVALHHLDPPWRPADIQQRDGRILRQKNQNDEVEIYRYVTEGSFDAYMWQLLEMKARFIAQVMRGDAGTRTASDIGGAELSAAEMKAIASGNPAMLVLAELEMEVRTLQTLRSAYGRERQHIDQRLELFPKQIQSLEVSIEALKEDIAARQDIKGDKFVMKVGDRTFSHDKKAKKTARQRAGDAFAKAFYQARSRVTASPTPVQVKLGSIGGMDIMLASDGTKKFDKYGSIILRGAGSHLVQRLDYEYQPRIGNLERTLKGMDATLAKMEEERSSLASDLAEYRKRADEPFAGEERYRQLVPLRSSLKHALQIEDDENDPRIAQTRERLIQDVLDRYEAVKSGAPEVETRSPAQDKRTAAAAPHAVVEADGREPDLAADTGITEADEAVAEPAPAVAPVEEQSQAPVDITTEAVADTEKPVSASTAEEQAEIPSVSAKASAKPVTLTAPERGVPAAERPVKRPVVAGSKPAKAKKSAEPAVTVANAPIGTTALLREVSRFGATSTLIATRVETGGWTTQYLYPDTSSVNSLFERQRIAAGGRSDANIAESLIGADELEPWMAIHLGDAERANLVDSQREAMAAFPSAESLSEDYLDSLGANAVLTLYGTDGKTEHPVLIADEFDDGYMITLLGDSIDTDRVSWNTGEQLRAPKHAVNIIKEVVRIGGEDERDVEAAEIGPVEAVSLPPAEPEVKAPEAAEVQPETDSTTGMVAVVEETDRDGVSWFSLAQRNPDGDDWTIVNIESREEYGVEDDAWVREHIAPADAIPMVEDYLTVDEKLELTAEQYKSVEPWFDAEQKQHDRASAAAAERQATGRSSSDVQGTLAIVEETDNDGISWFSLAEKNGTGWRLLNLESRAYYGRKDNVWVNKHIALPSFTLQGLYGDLTAEEQLRLIPEQRPVTVEQNAAPATQDAALQSTPTAPVFPRPVPTEPETAAERRSAPRRGKGQLGLFDSPEPAPAASVTPTDAITVQLPRNPVQMGLFGDGDVGGHFVATAHPAAAKDFKVTADEPKLKLEDLSEREQSIGLEIGIEFDYLWEGATWADAIRSYEGKFCTTISDRLYEFLTADDPEPEPSPWGSRWFPGDENAEVSDGSGQQTADDELYDLEMAARSKLDKDDPLYVAPPSVDVGDLNPQEQAQRDEIRMEFEFLWEGATWGQAIGRYEERTGDRIGAKLYDYLAAKDTEREIKRWKSGLSTVDENDIIDRLESHVADEPEPTEQAVLGRFTRRVNGEKRRSITQIIHDAVESYQSYGEMAQRIEQETGYSATDDRGTRSLYNATLARNSGWEAGR